MTAAQTNGSHGAFSSIPLREDANGGTTRLRGLEPVCRFVVV